MKKKLLIFSVAYHPFIGGAEIAVKELTDRLTDYDFDMITVNLDGKQKKYERIGNVNVYRVGRGKMGKYILPILGILKANALKKSNSYDAVWGIMASYSGIAALFFKILNPKSKFILTLQEGDSIDHIMLRAAPIFLIFKKMFKRADIVHSISSFLDKFAKDMGAKNTVIVPNGVHFSHFSSATPGSLERKNGEFILITTSRLVKKNAVLDIVKSLEFLPENIKLFILGEGPQKKSILEFIEKFSLQERVRFFGHVDHKDLPGFLVSSDVFVRPSLSEGFGNSFIEAMACGVPVIATPVGGIVDFVTDGKTGVFCEVKNPESIARAVEKIIYDEGFKKNIIDSARDMVLSNYDWEVVTNQMRERVLKSVLK